ncbi:branched-chain amino acid transporter permease [Pseudonocardia sp. MH-G8]|uniref:branched-chain amino acid transporter permease n=1 Tax=Pseudonocardia sp. MH-G8 TaxID=1854588 RepID=UPI000BA0B28C|nr:AzlD domain-containing protein [Pseudonocardia sp. MH-G8]OZM83236.1 branched-chain amino acid ABC transporter [Pseudonocardia sp. MH-G8]
MPDNGYVAAAVTVAAVITFVLRAAPFVVLSRLRDSATVSYLGRHLPAGVMVILVVYLLRDLPLERPAVALARLIAVAVTVGVHLWRAHALLSISAGTAAYAVVLAILPST